MKIATTISEVRDFLKTKRNLQIGLVPTMGYLHEGHQSLIERARNACDIVVVSDFVNEKQFCPGEDLDVYPRDFERDCQVCAAAGADLVFHPSMDEMYPEGFATFVEMEGLPEKLCGETRPRHFRGVCTVVLKLFHIVMPTRAYFGEKDAQQLLIIRRMVRDLNLPIEIVGCPIVREADGLAKSSRNTYLSPESRAAATVLSKSIFAGEHAFRNGETSPQRLIKLMRGILSAEPRAKIDYVKVVSLDTLEPVATLDTPFLAAIAVYIDGTRLIDNFMFTGKKEAAL